MRALRARPDGAAVKIIMVTTRSVREDILLAAQAGVRMSWGADFVTYTTHNVDATQRLLEAVKDRPLERFVYASSSSVYGDSVPIPMREDAMVQPVSPYGVTKLAAEHLCLLYAINYGVPAVSLRFFTVYGPKQRPDMGFHKFLRAALAGEAAPVADIHFHPVEPRTVRASLTVRM